MKRSSIGLLITAILLCSLNTGVYATEYKSSDVAISRGSISFSESDVVNKENDNIKQRIQKSLPKTGENHETIMALVGSLLIGIYIVSMINKKKQPNRREKQ